MIVRAGVAEVSIRSVAAEAGWSSGALRHYFATRAELLAAGCELVIEQVTARIAARPPGGDGAGAATALGEVRAILLQTMPVDQDRLVESTIAFAFLALGLSDPALSQVQRLHFTSMYQLCLRLVRGLDDHGALTAPHPDLETLARRLHALVDGLTVHVLAGHLSVQDMIEQLDGHLAELAGQPSWGH